MKKFVLVMVLLVFAAAGMVGCSPAVPKLGIAWSENERLSYDVIENKEKIGTLLIEITTLPDGEHKLDSLADSLGTKTFKITSSSTKGARVKMTVTDNAGKEMMYSESIVNGYVSLASYKRMNHEGKVYNYSAMHEGKYFYYDYNGGGKKRVKASAGYAYGDLMYQTVRCSEIEAAYSATLKVLNPALGNTENLTAIAASTDEKFEVRYTSEGGEPQSKTVGLTKLIFSKGDAPKGSSITVKYTKAAELSILGNAAKNVSSKRLPVEIIENNITYKLTLAEIF